MLALMLISSLVTLFVVYFLMPALWLHIMSIDDSLDAHEAGLTLVASRTCKIPTAVPPPQSILILPIGNPFRETGPPANMAKLILLRHKVSLSPSPSPLSDKTIYLGACLSLCRYRQITENDAALHTPAKPHVPLILPM